MHRIRIAIAVAMAAAILAVAAPAQAATTHYRHHRAVTGNVALTPRQVHRIERIVHHLPTCKPDQPTDCREHVGHRHTLASFRADHRTYYAGLVRGQLDHVEVYR